MIYRYLEARRETSHLISILKHKLYWKRCKPVTEFFMGSEERVHGKTSSRIA